MRDYRDYTEGVEDRYLQIKIWDQEGDVNLQITRFQEIPSDLAEEFREELSAVAEILSRRSFQEVENNG